MPETAHKAIAVVGIDIGRTRSTSSVWMNAVRFCCVRSGRGARGKHVLRTCHRAWSAWGPVSVRIISVAGIGRLVTAIYVRAIYVRSRYTLRCRPAQNVQLMAENEVRLGAGVAISPVTSASSTAVRPSRACGGMMRRFGTSQTILGRIEFLVATTGRMRLRAYFESDS